MVTYRFYRPCRDFVYSFPVSGALFALAHFDAGYHLAGLPARPTC